MDPRRQGQAEVAAAGGLTAAGLGVGLERRSGDYVYRRVAGGASREGLGRLRDVAGYGKDGAALSEPEVRALSRRGKWDKAAGARKPSPQQLARTRVNAARSQVLFDAAKRGAAARSMTLPVKGAASAALIGGGMVMAERGVSRLRKEPVAKHDVDVEARPYGIPSSRVQPLSPLAILGPSNIMADFLIGASGKNLNRRERKQVRQGAYGFAGARGMLYSPLGFGRSSVAM